jgi:hypothetical protein
VLYGAVDIRIYACVVEGTGDDRHRGRTCPATADRAFVIAALPGGDTTDDQPDDKKYRSDVHLDLRSIVCIKSDEKAIAIASLYLGPASGGSIPAGGDTESSAREFNVFSRNLEVGLGTTIG